MVGALSRFKLGMRSYMCVAISAVALVSCEAPVDSTPITLGEAGLNASEATRIFRKVCADPYPNFEASRAEIAKGNYRLDPTSDVIYSQDYDLSFKLITQGDILMCSMVFGSKDSRENLASALVPTGNNKGDVYFRATGDAVYSGQPLYNVVIGNAKPVYQ